MKRGTWAEINLNNIKHSMKNVIHENFRENLIPNFLEIKNKALELNALGVYLSGAGPTIMAITSQDNLDFKNSMDSFFESLENDWTIKELSICTNGTTIY